MRFKRRVFYIDVGKMTPEVAQRHLEQVKKDIKNGYEIINRRHV